MDVCCIPSRHLSLELDWIQPHQIESRRSGADIFPLIDKPLCNCAIKRGAEHRVGKLFTGDICSGPGNIKLTLPLIKLLLCSNPLGKKFLLARIISFSSCKISLCLNFLPFIF